MVTYTRTLLTPQYFIEPTPPKKAVFVRIEAKAPVKPHNSTGRNIHKGKRKGRRKPQ